MLFDNHHHTGECLTQCETVKLTTEDWLGYKGRRFPNLSQLHTIRSSSQTIMKTFALMSALALVVLALGSPREDRLTVTSTAGGPHGDSVSGNSFHDTMLICL